MKNALPCCREGTAALWIATDAAGTTEDCSTFWQKAAKDIGALVGKKWNNHPLAMALGTALYGYIEKKCKEKGGGQA